MKQFQKVIIVGGTSGLGLEMSRMLLESGASVVILGRNIESSSELVARFPGSGFTYSHDVSDTASVPQTFHEVTKDLGGLDLFVYAAGLMPEVEAREFNFTKDKAMLDVNVLGAVAWLDEVASRMQSSEHGSILVIGSVAGDRGRPAQPVYNSSKKFLHTFCESLRHRLNRVGVNVVVAKPGPMVTPMTAHLDQSKFMPVSTASAKCLKLAGRNGEFYLSTAHFLAMKVIKFLPGFVLRRTKL